ncbi:hypothetical protein GCM10009602_09300 [Nocardiopsis tropica]
MRVVLLSVLVFGHFLCSVCHATAVGTEAPTVANVVAASAETTDETVAGMALHGLKEDGRTVLYSTEGDISVDQRLSAEKMLMLLGIGTIITVVFQVAPAQPSPWLARRPLVTTRSAPLLFLSLCVQRV